MNDAGMVVEVDQRELGVEALERSVLEKLVYAIGRDPSHATTHDWFAALALAARDRMVDRWLATNRAYDARAQKRVYYLSMEFLIGRSLENALYNLGIADASREVMARVGVDLDEVIEAEPEAALGNGGLGRLAACFLDSMATIGVAGHGYGIRYEHGLFRQAFDDGWQTEAPEDWLRFGNPWEFERPEVSYPIDFNGHVEDVVDGAGQSRQVWHPSRRVQAVAYDSPVVGYGGRTVNTLRLWAAQSAIAIDLDRFNRGDYLRSVEEQVLARTLSRVLYPNDANAAGQELRLQQEYFFTSASLQDLLRRHLQRRLELDRLPDYVAIQLNDTHPAIAVPELMRLLIDRHDFTFERAFEITQACISYTNHTLLPEALERWPVDLMHRLLPRHMTLIEAIDAHVLAGVRASSKPVAPESLAVIDHAGHGVRMGHLAFVGSHQVNGVSALHTELMRETVFHQLDGCLPGRIVNQTNGITPRRWLHQCNRPLAQLLRSTIGDAWIQDLEAIEALTPFADDASFRTDYAAAKLANKAELAKLVREVAGVEADPEVLFDVQIKRIHEYKRQLLNLLHVIARYQAILADPKAGWQPRLVLLAGKAAPSYDRAKLIIKLANDIAAVINQDPATRDLLQLVFLPNYNVRLAERIIPAADLSEQISTAGMEASGTGNMKLALNGALTIGTLDGANVEIREQVGAEHVFIFGLTAPEVVKWRADPACSGRAVAAAEPRLRAVLDALGKGRFSPDDPNRYRGLIDDLLDRDYFLVTADFAAYWDAQLEVDRAFVDRDAWLRSAVLNTARTGWFSSDRTIRGYAREIWNAMPPAEGSNAG